MNGELAQLIAIAAHGNAALLAPDSPAGLWTGNSTLRYVNRLSFVRSPAPAGSTGPIALDIASWWCELRQRGLRRLTVVRTGQAIPGRNLPEYLDAAFAGGVHAGLLATFDRGADETWTARWEVTEPQHPNQAIWSVTYHGATVTGPGAVPPSTPLHQAVLELAESLRRIGSFATGNGLEEWSPRFTDALAMLSAPSPTVPYYPDLLPERGYSLPARRLMAAAAGGWVFGGMGSWNDSVPSAAAEYESVTQAHFEAEMNAFVTAANPPATQVPSTGGAL